MLKLSSGSMKLRPAANQFDRADRRLRRGISGEKVRHGPADYPDPDADTVEAQE